MAVGQQVGSRITLRADHRGPADTDTRRQARAGFDLPRTQPPAQQPCVARQRDQGQDQPAVVPAWQVVHADTTEEDIHPPVMREPDPKQQIGCHREQMQKQDDDQCPAAGFPAMSR